MLLDVFRRPFTLNRPNIDVPPPAPPTFLYLTEFRG